MSRSSSCSSSSPASPSVNRPRPMRRLGMVIRGNNSSFLLGGHSTVTGINISSTHGSSATACPPPLVWKTRSRSSVPISSTWGRAFPSVQLVLTAPLTAATMFLTSRATSASTRPGVCGSFGCVACRECGVQCTGAVRHWRIFHTEQPLGNQRSPVRQVGVVR